ncbi:MAG: hypothetical protein M3R25_11170 [Bacteroidota bacterium]|nr:hypothetical protein [Bacteroidota bacterium]
MKGIDYIGIIPPQTKGKEIEAEATIEFPDIDEAMNFYEVVKERLLNVNQWHHIAGFISAKFQLTDSNGNFVNRVPHVGDLFKIDVPGPGTSEGDGYDWVVIEDIKTLNADGREGIGIRVRPTFNPKGNKKETAHFYNSDSTSSFMVIRENNNVRAWIVDRNITPNTEPVSLIDRLRDSVVGMSALIKFSEIQWQKLADGLIRREE